VGNDAGKHYYFLNVISVNRSEYARCVLLGAAFVGREAQNKLLGLTVVE
jgi:hypothetical protein